MRAGRLTTDDAGTWDTLGEVDVVAGLLGKTLFACVAKQVRYGIYARMSDVTYELTPKLRVWFHVPRSPLECRILRVQDAIRA